MQSQDSRPHARHRRQRRARTLRPDSWHSFERLLPLLPHDIHAFALSQRGHGDSSRPALGYRFADMSEDLRAFMDARGLRTATIVGHSMGASVAQRFAQDRLLQVIPGAQLIVYEGYGHAFHWEDPALFAADLLSFLASEGQP